MARGFRRRAADGARGDDSSGTRRSSERPWQVAGLAALVALVGFVVYVVVAHSPAKPKPAAVQRFPDPQPPSLHVGTVAPAFDLPPITGRSPVSLGSYHGEPVIVNFFASWCKDCEAELSAFATVARLEAGHVAVVGVDTNDQDRAAALRLLRQAKAAYPVGVDARALTSTHYLLEALPTTYFVDAAGKVAGVAFGSQDVASLERWAALLDGSGSG